MSVGREYRDQALQTSATTSRSRRPQNENTNTHPIRTHGMTSDRLTHFTPSTYVEPYIPAPTSVTPHFHPSSNYNGYYRPNNVHRTFSSPASSSSSSSRDRTMRHTSSDDRDRYVAHKNNMSRIYLRHNFKIPSFRDTRRFEEHNEPKLPATPLPKRAPMIATPCIHCKRLTNIPYGCEVLCYRQFFLSQTEERCPGPDNCHFKHNVRIGESIKANMVVGLPDEELIGCLTARCERPFDRHDTHILVSITEEEQQEFLNSDMPFPRDEIMKNLIQIPAQMLVFGKLAKPV